MNSYNTKFSGLRIPAQALLLLAGIYACLAVPLRADSVRTYESRSNTEVTISQIKTFLDKFDQELYEEDETEGFKLKLESGFWSPFNYNMYIGPISRTQTTAVVRLEGDTGDVLTMGRILEKENILLGGSTDLAEDLKPIQLEEKNHFYSQGLNLIAPWLSVLHASWNSPRLSTGQTIFRFTAYFLFDGLMVWAGGTGFWQEPFNSKKYGGTIAAALVLPRIIGAWQHANLVRGHNRTARLGYTFYLE